MFFRSHIGLFFLVFGVGLSLAQAQPIEPSRANPALGKPSIKDQIVEGIEGEPVQITLKSEVSSPASIVEFVLRDYPTKGQLGTIVSDPNDRSQAFVTYQPDPGASGEDAFTFTARYRDLRGTNGLYAPSAAVTIRLAPAQPVVESPGVTNFGSIMIGDEAVREIYLRNTGNAEYASEIDFGGDEAQFQLVEPTDGMVRIPINGASIIKVAYRPTRIGETILNVVFHENKGGGTRFEAHAFAPFKAVDSAEEQVAEFVYQQDSRVRSVEIPLVNSATKPVTLNITTPPRVRATVGETLTLLPGQPEASVSLLLAADDVRPFSGDLILNAGNYSETISLEAAPSPAFLLANTLGAERNAINFGTVARGATAQRNLILQNIGGQVADVGYLLDSPFAVATSREEGDTLFTVPAEGSHQLTLRFTAPEQNGGQFRDKLQLVTAAGQKMEIELKAEVPMPEAIIPTAMQDRLRASQSRKPEEFDTESEVPLALQEMTVEEMTALSSASGFVAEEGYERRISNYIPPITDAQVEEITTNSIRLRWPMAGPGQVDYDIEMLAFATDAQTQLVRSVWLPYSDVEFEIKGDQVYATIGGLRPKISYEIRIITLGPTGRSSTPVLLFPILTKTPMDWTWIYVGFFAFLAATIGFFIYRLKLAREDD